MIMMMLMAISVMDVVDALVVHIDCNDDNDDSGGGHNNDGNHWSW